MGKLEFCGIFKTHNIKARKFRGNFRSILRRKFVTRKNASFEIRSADVAP